MKKFFLFVFTFFLSIQILVTPAFAQNDVEPLADTPLQICPTGSQFDELCKYTEEDFGGIVSFGVNVLLVVAVVIALFFLVFGGIKWILSGGDKGGVEAARNMIVAAIVGLILAFLAFFVLNIVLGFFEVDLDQLTIPSLSDALNGGGDPSDPGGPGCPPSDPDCQ